MDTGFESHLLEVARFHAGQHGITGDAAKECAIGFLERTLRLHLEGDGSEALLHRCADNWAKDYARRQARLRKREVPWPEQVCDDGSRQAWDAPGQEIGTEDHVFHGELMARIMAAVRQLTANQQELYRCHFVLGESAEEIAISLDRTRHAVEQSLSKICKRLRSILKRQGLTEAEAWDYLSTPPINSKHILHYQSLIPTNSGSTKISKITPEFLPVCSVI